MNNINSRLHLLKDSCREKSEKILSNVLELLILVADLVEVPDSTVSKAVGNQADSPGIGMTNTLTKAHGEINTAQIEMVKSPKAPQNIKVAHAKTSTTCAEIVFKRFLHGVHLHLKAKLRLAMSAMRQ